MGTDRLKDKVVLITGAGRGIGRATAIRLAQEGARVAINFLFNPEEAEKTVSQIQSFGGTAMSLKADVTQGEEVNEMVKKIIVELRTIDGLVNNAVAPLQLKKFEDLEWDDFSKHFEVQIHGAYNTVRAVLPCMQKNRSGSIVNIASEVTIGVTPSGFAGYNAAKFATWGLTKTLASELRNYNIHVNAISPGFVNTDLTKSLPDIYKQVMVSQSKDGKATLPEEVAETVCYVLADVSFTGMNLPVGE